MLLAYCGVYIRGNKNTLTAKSASWFFWGVAIVFYTILLGLRENVGIDYTSYRELFNSLIRWGKDSVKTDMIYYIFLPIVKNFHYNFFIAFLAFITIFFLFRSLERNREVLLWYLFFFFALGTFFLSLNIMRQTAAAFVVFYAMNLLLRAKLKKGILYFFLAFIIHRSSLVLFPFIFLFRYDFLRGRWVQYLLLFSSLVVGNILFEKLSPILSSLDFIGLENSYGWYFQNFEIGSNRALEMKSEYNGTGVFNYLTLFLNCIVIFYSVKLKEKFKHQYFTFFYNFFIFGIILNNLIQFNEGMSRIISYFTFYSVYIYSIFYYYLFQRTENNSALLVKFSCLIILLLGIAFFYNSIFHKRMEIAPFQFLD